MPSNKQAPPKLNNQQRQNKTLSKGPSTNESTDQDREVSLLSIFGSAAQYAQKNRDLIESVGKEKYRDHDQLVLDFAYSPAYILELANTRLVAAANFCFAACKQLGDRSRRRLLEYLTLGYELALRFRSDDEKLKELRFYMEDGRYRDGKPSLEEVQGNRLHYLFLYFFYQSGLTSKDRARQHAVALKPYYETETSTVEVHKALRKHGEDRLRRAAQLRNNLRAGAREWAQEGGNPATVTMEEALAKVIAKERARKGQPEVEEPPIWEGREIPPDGSTPDLEGELSIDDDDGFADDHLGEELPGDSSLDQPQGAPEGEPETHDRRKPEGVEQALLLEMDRFCNEVMLRSFEVSQTLKGNGPNAARRAALVDLGYELFRKTTLIKLNVVRAYLDHSRAQGIARR